MFTDLPNHFLLGTECINIYGKGGRTGGVVHFVLRPSYHWNLLDGRMGGIYWEPPKASGKAVARNPFGIKINI
jgi:hypothetical protein